MRTKKGDKPRNLLHDHPLLRKGGVHAKSRKSERRSTKVGIRREWCPHSAFAQSVVSTPLLAGSRA
jgi:hypothetical protein